MIKSMSRSMKHSRLMKPDMESLNASLAYSDSFEKKDDLGVSIKNYKEKTKSKELVQLDSIQMLTENLDPLYDIESI